jgi:hypothetical protein
MATYIPNVNPYLPEVKTFTPDYKFLSDALTQRQGKYNTNYKQLNNAYSKIVYTELSRGDTNDARTQFVNNLQPEIEKISGLDLSLAQNTRAAQGVFQPFYDNDLVVKDMVMTKDYRSKMAYAQGLAESSKEEDNQKYWDEGVKAIQYKMDDFINASQEDALNSYLPSYTQNPQLHKRAMAYLKEQGYSMKYDEISKDGNFIITTSQGKNVTATAMAGLKMKFLQDDLLNKAYYTKSYVDSRQYAEKKMKEGKVSTISEGILEYNKGTLQSYSEATKARIVQYDEQINTLTADLESLETQMKGRVAKPGSSTALSINLMQDKLEGAKMNKEIAIKSAAKAAEVLSSNNPKSINDKGYSMQMQSNIMGDLQMAAQNYSMINAERTLKVNEVKMQDRKEIHQVRLADMNFKNSLLAKEKETEQQAIRLQNKIDIYKEAGLTPDGKPIEKSLVDIINDVKKGMGLGSSNEGLITTDKTLTVDQDYNEIQEDYLETLARENTNSSISNYMAAQVFQNGNKKIDGKSIANLIKVPVGMNVTKEVPAKMFVRIGNELYLSKENFRKLVSGSKENVLVFENESASFFNKKFESAELSDLKTEYFSLQEHAIQLLEKEKALTKAQHDNLVVGMKMEGTEGKPMIYEKNEDGTHKHLSRKEYEEKFVNWQSKQDFVDFKEMDEEYNSNSKYFRMLKPENDNAWKLLESGKIKPWIKVKNKYGTITEIINPHLVGEGTGKNREGATLQLQRFIEKHPGPGFHSHPSRVHYKGWGENPSADAIKLVKFQDKSAYASTEYDGQTKLLNKINIGEYTDKPTDAFTYVNLIASDYGIDNEGVNRANLFTGKDVGYKMDNIQFGNPNDNKNEIKQALYLEDALNKNGVLVNEKSIDVETGKSLNSIQAKQDVYNILQLWKTKKLSDKYEYNIKYSPAIAGEDFSTYTIDKTHKLTPTTKVAFISKTQSIEVKVPVNEDLNDRNIKNDKTRYVLNGLINPETGQYNRSFDDNTNINVLKENGLWSIDFNLNQYNPETNEFDEMDAAYLMSQYKISDYSTTSNGEADQKYLDYVMQASRWSGIQISNKTKTEKEFSKYLERNKINPASATDTDWDNFRKTKQ